MVIDGGSGSIDVTGTSAVHRDRVAAGVVLEQAADRRPRAARHHADAVLQCPAELVCGVSYDVQVPRDVAVSVATGAGSVTLTSLAGTVTARADAGLITAVDLRSAVASFKSNAGGVVATFSAAPRSLTATTNVGPITLTVPGSVAYQVSTHTVVGTLDHHRAPERQLRALDQRELRPRLHLGQPGVTPVPAPAPARAGQEPGQLGRLRRRVVLVALADRHAERLAAGR